MRIYTADEMRHWPPERIVEHVRFIFKVAGKHRIKEVSNAAGPISKA